MDSATGLLDCFQKLGGWQEIIVDYGGATFATSSEPFDIGEPSITGPHADDYRP
jgi:hypothetical protein